MRTSSKLAVLLVSIALILAAIVVAPSITVADDDEDLVEARRLYSLGNAHYAAGRYEKAARAFQKGYELSELPGFLYNLANAYERMGEYNKAADKLELYLESPKAKDVVSVKERVRRLRAAAKARAKEIEKQKAREEAAARLERLRRSERGERDVEYDSGPRPNTYLYFAGGAGVAFAGAGIFALVSRSAASSAASKCGAGGICDRSAEADFDRETNFAMATDVSLALGIVLVGVSGYLYFKGGPKVRRERGDIADDEDEDDSDSEESDDGVDVRLAPLIGVDTFGVGAVGRF